MKSIPSRPDVTGLTVARCIGIILMLAVLAGCGADWLPEFKRQPTTPDPFTFTQQTEVVPNTSVTSNTITIAGVTADSTPITISGTATSKYSVNGGTPTSANGSVKNGDKISVTHTTVTGPGLNTTSTVTIGGVSGSFTTVNQLVDTPSFTLVPGTSGLEATAQLTAFDSATTIHQISIADTGSGLSRYFILDSSNTSTIVSSTNQTSRLAALNSDRLYVTVPNTSTMLKLTIDNVEFDLTFSTNGVSVNRVP